MHKMAAGKWAGLTGLRRGKGTEGRVVETEALRRLCALACKPKHKAFKTRHTKPIKNNSTHMQTNPKID